MQTPETFSPSVSESLMAGEIGRLALRWLREYEPTLLAQEVDTAAVRLLEQIRGISDDKTLSDPQCFYQIDLLTSAFFDAGLATTRHEEVE